MEEEDWYGVLGLEYGASEKDIVKAYRLKALIYHPDKAGDDEEASKLGNYLHDFQRGNFILFQELTMF